jgi:hypothetical protein
MLRILSCPLIAFPRMLSRRGTAECANDDEARVAHGGPSVTETTVASVRRHVDDQFVMLCRH